MEIDRGSRHSPTLLLKQPEADRPPICPSYAFGSRAGDFDDEPFLEPRTFALPELPWESIAGRLEQVAIGIMRFDARLQASDLAAG
jgi:hypothetical protein